MTSHISQEDYQNLRKVLQAKAARRSSKAGGKGSRTHVDLQTDLTGVERVKAGIVESDSDSGYTNSISSTLASSGTSVDSVPLQREGAVPRDVSVSSDISSPNMKHYESEDANLNTQENGKQSSTQSSVTCDPGDRSREDGEVASSEVGDSITRNDDETRASDDDNHVMQTTPSNLFRKIRNRQSGVEAGGVGSFASFTSPSDLFKKDKMEDEGSPENHRSIGEDIDYPGLHQPGEADSVFEYSTPSKLFLKRQYHQDSENAAGVGSFESFTSPSELFKKRQSSSHNERDHSRLNKSSAELLKMNVDPSELLKRKTEIMALERIASAKAVDTPPSYEMVAEGHEETGKSVDEGGSSSRDKSLIAEAGEETEQLQSDVGLNDINVQIEDDSTLDKDHVDLQKCPQIKATFQEKVGVSRSSESDISLILEDAKDGEEGTSSGDDEQEELDLPRAVIARHHHGCIWHKSQEKPPPVTKARSYPLMQLTRNMLCCVDDAIRCECSDKESVEKLVGLAIDDDDGTGQDLEEDSISLENSHSWADATWRSLEMVIKKEHSTNEENQWDPPSWRPFKSTSPNTEQSPESQNNKLLESLKEELEALRKLKLERDWSMMEEKLEMSRKLLRQQQEREQEKTHLIQTHHKIVDEMMENQQKTEMKVKEQENEISTLREKIHRGEEEFYNEYMEMERQQRAWNDCKANLEQQLMSATEENCTLLIFQKEIVKSVEVMQGKIDSLTFELSHYKSECERLEGILSEQQQQISIENASQDPNTLHSRTTEAAQVNICIEVDEDQNRLTIETCLDRKFVCGDGTKTDEEIQEITENLTMFIKDEVSHNLFPLLYQRNPFPEKDGDESIILPPSSSPTAVRSHAAEAEVVISLDAEDDTNVKIHAQMDAGFLGAGRREEEVDDIIQSVAMYVKEHFLQGILMQLFPDKDEESLLAISSHISSSSLHNFLSISGTNVPHLLKLTCTDDKEDEEITDSRKVAEKQSEVIEGLEASLQESNNEVTALQSVVRKQEVEYAKLNERCKRRETQLKDVCCQFTENERRWIEEKDALEQTLKENDIKMEELQRQLKEIESHGEVLSAELKGQISDLMDSELQLRTQLQEREKEVTMKKKKLFAMENKLQSETQAFLELKDEKDDLVGKLSEKQEELMNLSSQFESSRLALEEQLRCYEVMLKEKDDTIAKLSTLQVGKGSDVSVIDEKKILEQLVASLKMENFKLQSHLKTLTLAGMQSPTVKTSPTCRKQEMQPSDNVSVPWEEYQAFIGEKYHLTVMVDQLKREKQDHVVWGKVLEEKVQHFQLEISELKKKIKHLTGDLDSAIQDTESLKQQLVTDEVKADFSLQTKLREVERRKEKAEKNLEEKVTSLSIEKGQLVSERTHWQEDVRLLKEEKKTLLVNLEECNKKLCSCQEDLKSTIEQLNVKEADLIEANHQIEEVRKERDRAVSRLGDLYQDLMKAQADIGRTQESKRRDVDRLESQITSLEKDIHCNKKELDQAQNNLTAVKSELEQQNISHKVKVDTIEKLQQEKDLIQAQITVLEERLEQKETGAFVITDSLVKKQEEVDCLQHRLSVLSSEVVQTRAALSDKTKHFEEEKMLVENLKVELMHLTQEKSERVNEVEHLEEKYSQQEEKIREFEETVEELQKENVRLRNELQNVDEEKEELSNTVGKLQQQYQTLFENHTRLDCKSESDAKFNTYLQEELENSKSVIEQLKDTVKEMKKEVEVNEVAYKEQEVNLKRALSESEQEMTRLQQSLNDAKKLIETLQESGKEQAVKLTDEQEQIASLTTDLEQLQKEFVAERKLVKKLGEEKEEIRAQLDEKIEKLSNEKNLLQEEVFQAKLSAKVCRVKHGQVGTQLKHLKQCVDEQIENSMKNVEQTAALKKDIERLHEENAGLKNTINILKENESEAIKEIADKKKEICDISDRLTQAEYQSRAYQNKIEELEVLLQNEKMAAESLKRVNKEKKKKWLLSNQLFSSKVKTQLQTGDEKITQLQDDLMKAHHESQLHRCEVSEKMQVIQRLQEKISILEDNQSGLEEDLRRAESQIRKEQDLAKALNDRLLHCHEEMKSNLKEKWSSCNKLTCLNHTCVSNSSFDDIEGRSMYNKMKLIQAEMKKNLREEVKDQVKQITKQIVPTSTPTDARIEDIATEICKMKQQRQWEKEKMESIAMNIDKLNLTVQNQQQKNLNNVRTSSTPEEISRAFKVANMRAMSRANNSQSSNCACSRDQTDATTFIGPEASIINDSTMLAGSADVFHSTQRQSPSPFSTKRHFNELIRE